MVKCAKCFAELDDSLSVCPYCGSVLQKFPETIEFKANMYFGLNAKGGKLIITPTQMIFHPHMFNFGGTEDEVFNIKDITGYKKGILTIMTISLSGGKSVKLAVWSKDKIIRELEARRKLL